MDVTQQHQADQEQAHTPTTCNSVHALHGLNQYEHTRPVALSRLDASPRPLEPAAPHAVDELSHPAAFQGPEAADVNPACRWP